MANIVLIPNTLGGLNYSIVPTVTSNNLTVAIKDAAGNDPTSSSPCVFRIGGSERILSTALSVTKNAGTNWFGAGDARFAGLEIDYFVYIGYNATDGITMGFSRIGYAATYSNFSATTTNEKYGAISTITNAAATDDYVCIGRFAATLSAAASYNWSVPTYTGGNLINRPITFTRILSYVPTWVASGTAVSLGNATLTGSYKIEDRTVLTRILFTAGNTTTFGTGTYSWAAPFAENATGNGAARLLDSGTGVFTATLESLGSTIIAYPDGGAANIVSQTIPFTWASGDTIRGQISMGI